MVKGKKTIVVSFICLLILAIPVSIAVAIPAIYSFYLPIIDKYPSPTPTKTPLSTATLTPTPTFFPSPTPTFTATSTQSPPHITGNVQIINIFYDGSGQFEPDEYVEIQNKDTFSIQLVNWTLRDQASHIFTFPSFVIQPNQICRVYTNQDHPESCGFNFHSGVAIWNNGGDCGYLRDSSGTQISQFCYP